MVESWGSFKGLFEGSGYGFKGIYVINIVRFFLVLFSYVGYGCRLVGELDLIRVGFY